MESQHPEPHDRALHTQRPPTSSSPGEQPHTPSVQAWQEEHVLPPIPHCELPPLITQVPLASQQPETQVEALHSQPQPLAATRVSRPSNDETFTGTSSRQGAERKWWDRRDVLKSVAPRRYTAPVACLAVRRVPQRSRTRVVRSHRRTSGPRDDRHKVHRGADLHWRAPRAIGREPHVVRGAVDAAHVSHLGERAALTLRDRR